MKKVKIEDAVGYKLLHDVTEVNMENNFKGIAFKKGYTVSEKDIEKFKSIGKYYIFVEEPEDKSLIHEDEAALKTAPLIAGENIFFDKTPKEGKINFYAEKDGLFKVRKDKIIEINKLKVPSLPTIHNNFPVRKNKLVAAFRIIPLFCSKDIIESCFNILTEPVLTVKPFKLKTASIIVTGNEIYNGNVKDRFIPVISEKLEFYNIKIINKAILPDNALKLTEKISEFQRESDILFVTGGTSVDPDDITRDSMKEAGAVIIQEGCPIQPGNNLTLGYIERTPVLAIPAAAIFFKTTSLDIILPRIIAGETVSHEDFAEYSIGGLCHFCKNCTYPSCSFGKE